MKSRVARLLLSAALFALIGAGLVVDASSRRTTWTLSRPARLARVRELGFADLALSSSSRWLRHPSLVERAAAVADTPDSLDTDPAVGLLPPERSAP